MNGFLRARFLFVCLLLAALPCSLFAQNYDNPGLGELPVAIHPQDFKPLGIRAGGFMLHPGVQLAAQYTDNVFYTAENEQSDISYHIRPYITAQSNWSRHALNIRLSADIARYQDATFQDYEDYFLLINGRIDVRNRSFFSYSLDYMNLHEGRNNRDAEQGFQPTRYHMYGGSLGFDHIFNRLSIGLLGTWRRLDFDDSESIDGEVIDNQDRDRDETSLAVRAAYQFKTDRQVFMRASTNRVRYVEQFDRNGIDRSSDGYTVGAGLAFNITGVLNGDVSVNWHDQRYADPNLPNVSGWALGAGIGWNPTRMTSVGVRVSSNVQPTTTEFSSGYLMTLYSIRVDHELRRDLQINAQISLRDNDYQLTADAPEGTRSNDKVWMAGVGMSYFVNRYIFLNASYNFEKLTSDAVNDKYSTNTFWLVLSFER